MSVPTTPPAVRIPPRLVPDQPSVAEPRRKVLLPPRRRFVVLRQLQSGPAHADPCDFAIDHLLMVLLSKQLRFENSFREDFRLWSCRANRASSFSSERNCHKVCTSGNSDGTQPSGTAPTGPLTCCTYLEWLRQAVGASRPARGSCARHSAHFVAPESRPKHADPCSIAIDHLHCVLLSK